MGTGKDHIARRLGCWGVGEKLVRDVPAAGWGEELVRGEPIALASEAEEGDGV